MIVGVGVAEFQLFGTHLANAIILSIYRQLLIITEDSILVQLYRSILLYEMPYQDSVSKLDGLLIIRTSADCGVEPN